MRERERVSVHFLVCFVQGRAGKDTLLLLFVNVSPVSWSRSNESNSLLFRRLFLADIIVRLLFANYAHVGCWGWMGWEGSGEEGEEFRSEERQENGQVGSCVCLVLACLVGFSLERSSHVGINHLLEDVARFNFRFPPLLRPLAHGEVLPPSTIPPGVWCGKAQAGVVYRPCAGVTLLRFLRLALLDRRAGPLTCTPTLKVRP